MGRYLQPGQIMEYANAGTAISAGDFIVIGNRVGCAITDIAATTGTGSVYMEGVFSASKDNDEAFTQGQALYFDSSDSTFTGTATGNKWAGYAFEAAGETDTSCVVKLEAKSKQATVVAALAGTLTGTVDGTLDDVAAVSTAGGNTYADSAINTAITSINLQLKELQTTLNAVIAAQKASGQMANA